jgi:hypothetical protein
MLEKNKVLNKRNDDLSQTLQRMEEKLKGLAKENLEMVSGIEIELQTIVLNWESPF